MHGNVANRTNPGAEPISLAEAIEHCRANPGEEDALISGLIAAARAHVENVTGRLMITRRVRATFPHFPNTQFEGRRTLDNSSCGSQFSRYLDEHHPKTMRLCGPVRKVESITYLDENKTSQTLSTSIYDVDAGESAGAVSLAYGQVWPAIYVHPAAVAINFISGYATPFTVDATTNAVTAIGHPYADGDIVQLYNSGGGLPAGVLPETDYYVVAASGNALQLAASEGGAAIDITNAGSGKHYIGVVPAEIRQAMLLLIAHWYENREAVIVGSRIVVADNPMAVDMLLAPMRVMGF